MLNSQISKWAVGLALLGLTSLANAAPFLYSGPSGTHVDTNPASNFSFVVSQSGIIEDLNLSVYITGGHMEDFDLYLTGPDGTNIHVLQAMHDLGHVDSPLTATFDDEGTSTRANLAANPSAGLSVIPTVALSAFDGKNLAGTWTLSILDAFVPGEGDSLVSWSISGDVPVPGPLALLGIGLLGLGLVRRKK